jgi:hypothetical protein
MSGKVQVLQKELNTLRRISVKVLRERFRERTGSGKMHLCLYLDDRIDERFQKDVGS